MITMPKIESRVGRVIAWVLGILVGLLVIFYASAQIWLSTWKTYRNEEFGFSFRYPGNWHISGYYDTKDKGEVRAVGFYVDSKEGLPNSPMDPVRSPGNVRVTLENSPSTIEAHKLQKDFSKLKRVKLGKKFGLVDEGVGRTTASLGSLFVFGKQLYVENSGYFYYVNTLTYSDNVSVFSQIKARYYHLIGSTILDSFKFD